MDYSSEKGPVIDPYDTGVNKNKQKLLIIVGAIVLIGAAFYFIFSGGSENSSSNAETDEIKLIDQTIKEVQGKIGSIDTKASTFVLVTDSSLTEYTVATFPETEWSSKKDSILKKDTKVKVIYIDALKTMGMLYAANIEKIK